MRIEELIIDGFKSYPVRTQISGWDPSFNAITGLNGSGKSNILDAICFVLGLANMSTMRAANQQDLIYKRGQAGVVKASVTIVFDNSDPAKSPDGYQNYKQITVTRQIAMPNVTKYLLNGHKAQQQQILNLFQSVQLNINNPNFVIMQGRITKVLNMRPQEILGMVEEAAGTRMFEERKDKALKTMKKKEKRVQEITNDLENEIKPKLEKLRAEKRKFMEYTKAVKELEHIARKMKAWEWTDCKAKLESKDTEIEEKRQEIQVLDGKKKNAKKEIKAAEKGVETVTAQRNAEISKGGKLKKLQGKVDDIEKEVVRFRTQVEINENSVKQEESRSKDLVEDLKRVDAIVAKQDKKFKAQEAAFNEIRATHTRLEEKFQSDEELLQTLLTGLTSGNANSGGGYMGQLADAKTRLAQASTEEKQAKFKLGVAQNELKVLEAKKKDSEREAAGNLKTLEKMQKSLDDARASLAKINWSKEKEDDFVARLNEAKTASRRFSDRRDGVKQTLGRLNFEYSDPCQGFDRRTVKGLAAQLISLKDENRDKATALEIVAGNRLFNVVVENEKVGSDLLKNGRLRKRVTLIPLNKITPRIIQPERLKNAERLAPGKVRTAISLVGYAEDVARAVEFVFGDTLICDTSDIANRVTFHPSVLTKSVTIEGDVYDPSGTMTGGSAPTGNRILLEVQDLLKAEAQLSEAKERERVLEQEEAKARVPREQWRSLTNQLEMKEHELTLLKEQVQGSNAQMNIQKVEASQATIEGLEKAVKSAQDKQKEAEEECKKLNKDMAEFSNNKEGKIDELKESIKKQKAGEQKHAQIVKSKQKELATAKLELDQLGHEHDDKQKELDEAADGLAALQEKLEEIRAEVESKEAEFKKLSAELEDELATLKRFDVELKELDRVIKEKKEVMDQVDMSISKMEHDIGSLEKEKERAQYLTDQLERLNEWIEQDKHLFGKPGGMYDFSGDMNQLTERRKELQDAQNGMKKKVNPKVMNVIEPVEKREAELTKNLQTVNKDKEKIEETIEELDRYKLDALEKTWEKVNKDFGGIFAELLPGNFAKLQPPEGQELTDGLEVKVQLGSVWKQSLTELSGGQRSLIALSLIMALLQFKPAPMYILDEIDAALDLSHTQHIGQLFRTRFKGSQFVVVSLKEGLFTNANVLFRARFRDGTSIVERTAQRSTSALYNDREDDDDGRNRRRGGRIGGGS